MMRLRSTLCLLTLALLSCGDEEEGESPFTFTVLGRAEHTEQFPIAEGVHSISDCNDCHGGFESFTEFSCIQGCHNGTGHPEEATALRHDGVPGYVWDTPFCFGCHPEGT